jgi:hypothetical protein
MRAIHQSDVKMFFNCPEQYRRAVILRQPPVFGDALFQGSAVHYALNQHFAKKKLDGVGLTADQVKMLFEHEMRTGSNFTSDPRHTPGTRIVWNRTVDMAIDEGVTLIDHFFETVEDMFVPIESEIRLSKGVPNSDIVIEGTIDHLDVQGFMADWKVTGNPKNKPEVRKDLQPIFYAFLTGGPIVFKFVSLVKRRVPEIQIATVEVLQESIDWVTDVMLPKFVEALDKGVFVPNSTLWNCQPAYCGWFDDCRKVENPEVVVERFQ